MGEHLEAEIAAASVYGDDHALRPELLSQLAHQLGTVDCSRVNRDLVRTHPQEAARVLHAADAPADREGDEDLLGDPSGHLDSRVTGIRRGCDVQEHELVGALGVVAGGQLHRVPRVAEIDEFHALDDAPSVNVQAGDDGSGPRAEEQTPVLKSLMRSAYA